MSDRPIYVDRGQGTFERFNGKLADLQVVGWPDFFPGRLPLGVSSVSPAADHVYYNDAVPADLMSMTVPDEATWNALRQFLAREGP
jgi:hypothetical protein